MIELRACAPLQTMSLPGIYISDHKYLPNTAYGITCTTYFLFVNFAGLISVPMKTMSVQSSPALNVPTTSPSRSATSCSNVLFVKNHCLLEKPLLGSSFTARSASSSSPFRSLARTYPSLNLRRQSPRHLPRFLQQRRKTLSQSRRRPIYPPTPPINASCPPGATTSLKPA